METRNDNKKMLSYDDVMRMNERMRERQRERIKDIKITIPKRYKIVGVGIVCLSVFPVGLDIVTIPLGVSIATSTNRKQIVPNFIRIFTQNAKKLVRMVKNAYTVCLYDKMGVRRRWKE